MKIRGYQTVDLESLLKLFQQAVMQVAAANYSQEQLIAWASSAEDMQEWDDRLREQQVVICESGSRIAGFASMENNGHLDLMYVHPESMRQGVATRLYEDLEDWARGQSILRVFTEASLTALPFFQKMGFKTVARQSVERNGVTLDNFRMEKYLRPTDLSS